MKLPRFTLRDLFWLVLVVAPLALLADEPGTVPSPIFSFSLEKASLAVGNEGRFGFVWCDVNLTNNTKGDVVLRTDNPSVFSDLEVVVTSLDDKVLARKKHEVPESVSHLRDELTLTTADNPQLITFHFDELPKDTDRVRVQLVGSVPHPEGSLRVKTKAREVRVQRGFWTGMWLHNRKGELAVHIYCDGRCESGVGGLIHALKDDDQVFAKTPPPG